jgi:hypothetical protein
MKMGRYLSTFVLCASIIVGLTAFAAAQGGTPRQGTGKTRGANAKNMALLGHNDLQGRSAYQPIILRQGDRWISFVGHHAGSAFNPLTKRKERNGTSILDVTDPKNPVYLHHIPGRSGWGGAQMVQGCHGKDLPRADSRKTYLLRNNGHLSHEVWDVTDLKNPKFVKTVVEAEDPAWGGKDTHKNWWDCASGVAYLVSSASSWRTPRVMRVFDLGDPARPVFVRNFGLVGQEPGSSGPRPGGSGLHETVLFGNRLYLAYGTSSNGVFQIVDRDKLLNGNPALPRGHRLSDTPENLLYPQVGLFEMPSHLGGHTAFPLIGITTGNPGSGSGKEARDFAAVTSESIQNECNEPRHVVIFFDITDERTPSPVFTFQVPESSGNFCKVGGRFGPHATNWSFTETFYKKILLISYFNAGVRAIDVRNPVRPQEVAFFIPATTGNTAPRSGKVAIQTNNVEVDNRGFIYLVDRANTGLHIVELTGAAHKIVCMANC